MRDIFQLRYFPLPLIAYEHLSTIPNPNSTSVFFRHVCILILGIIKKYKKVGSISVISFNAFIAKFSNKSSCNNVLLCTYISWCSCILKSFSILKSFWKHFLHVCCQDQWCIPLSDCGKVVSSLTITFYWIFGNSPCSQMDKNLFATADKI